MKKEILNKYTLSREKKKNIIYTYNIIVHFYFELNIKYTQKKNERTKGLSQTLKAGIFC